MSPNQKKWRDYLQKMGRKIYTSVERKRERIGGGGIDREIRTILRSFPHHYKLCEYQSKSTQLAEQSTANKILEKMLILYVEGRCLLKWKWIIEAAEKVIFKTGNNELQVASHAGFQLKRFSNTFIILLVKIAYGSNFALWLQFVSNYTQ